MGYDYTCDDGRSPECLGSVTGDLPALMGDVNENWFEATEAGGQLAEAGFHPAQTVTVCPACLLVTLLDSR